MRQFCINTFGRSTFYPTTSCYLHVALNTYFDNEKANNNFTLLLLCWFSDIWDGKKQFAFGNVRAYLFMIPSKFWLLGLMRGKEVEGQVEVEIRVTFSMCWSLLTMIILKNISDNDIKDLYIQTEILLCSEEKVNPDSTWHLLHPA